MMLASTPVRSALIWIALCIAAVAVALFAGAAPARAHHNTLTQTCKELAPGSPVWDQLDPGIQNAILNRLTSTIRPGSPGWDKLDPGIQNAILNSPWYSCARRFRNSP